MVAKSKQVQHPAHQEHLPHLNRVKGQIEGIRNMIQQQRYCPDILIQLDAARASIRAIELKILDKHISCCVADAFAKPNLKEQQQKITEICKIIRKLK